jgi:hypothetical protein
MAPAVAGAHKYISLPVLVNVCGSHDHAVHEGGFESRAAYVDAVREQIEMACKDINLRLLDDPPAGAEQDVVLRLGPIRVVDVASCPDDVTQETAALRTLFADGRKELKEKQADKGIKINVVNVVREKPKAGGTEGRPIPAVGETGAAETVKTPAGGTETVHHGRNVAIDDHTLRVGLEVVEEGSGESEPCGTNGEILLHEIGHNSGLVREHGSGDADETGFMTSPPGRAVTADQWRKLRRFWERFGNESRNEEQHSYLPRTDDTHHALVTRPWPAQPGVDSLAVAVAPGGWLRGRVELAGLLPAAGFFDYTVHIAVNTDNDVTTCGEFYEFGEGYDLVVSATVSSNPVVYAPAMGFGSASTAAGGRRATAGAGPYVAGSLTYRAGLQYVTVPLAAVHVSEVGSVGAGGGYAAHASVLTFAHDIGAFAIAGGAIPARAMLVRDGLLAGFAGLALAPVPDPELTSLPMTVSAFAPVPVMGAGFAPGRPLSVWLAHVRSFANDPVAAGVTGGDGGFGLVVDVPGPRAGDFVVTAMDADGYLATGVVTAAVPCSLACSAAAPECALVGAPVPFSVTVTPTACAAPVAHQWSFGDGATGSAGSAAVHAYAASGIYAWSVTASSGSASCTAGGSVAVIDPATAVRRVLRPR